MIRKIPVGGRPGRPRSRRPVVPSTAAARLDPFSVSRPIRILLALGICLALGCRADPRVSDFHAGMSRGEIVSGFGEPDMRRVMEKRDPHVWGPIETFWSTVPMGSRVEIWSYPVSGGAVELYFLDGSPQVQATGFAPKDAVF